MAELARIGLTDVCMAPGSRSTPLVLAGAAEERLRLRVHLDERSAAFFALGLARATGRPAAVLTTSGTAVANLLPAVVEASLSEIPLLLITADRPRRLRGADANQTIDQAGIFGAHVRAAYDLPDPSLDPADVRHLRVVAARAWADAWGGPAGPVHLNVPLAKPLQLSAGVSVPAPEEAVPEAYAGDRGRPAVHVTRRRAALGRDDADGVVERMAQAERGVVVVGPVPEPEAVGAAAVRLSERTGFPLLADPLSGARWRPHGEALVADAYDLHLAVPELRRALRPDLVVRVGRAPTSKHLNRWLEDHGDVDQVILDSGRRWKDHGETASHYLRVDAAEALERLAEAARPSGSEEWRSRWRTYGDVARGAAQGSPDFGPGHEGAVLQAVVEAVSGPEALFVGSSMPIRDLDAFGAPAPRTSPLLAFGNRGASGIDGTVSTALGVAAGTGRRVVAVLGDLAFYHDLNGLLAIREEGVEVVFVVVQNDGGGIFHLLPVREHEPDFEPYFATPHGLDFRHAARLYGLPHTLADDPAGFRDALFGALEAGGTRVVEVRTNRNENEARHRAVRDTVRVAVLEALKKEGEQP
jgi:2-succinyl-5-enolpyruvyl-6-hydroxy-3-cyclohexene-1-carboxylate synthase